MRTKIALLIGLILVSTFFSGCGPQKTVDPNDTIIWDGVESAPQTTPGKI